MPIKHLKSYLRVYKIQKEKTMLELGYYPSIS
jgi:hypothetical protein